MVENEGTEKRHPNYAVTKEEQPTDIEQCKLFEIRFSDATPHPYTVTVILATMERYRIERDVQ